MKAKFYTYRNLHKGGFSVKHRGLVVDRFDIAVITNPHFQVSQAGRKRAIFDKVRNVHAYIASSHKPEIRNEWYPPQEELIEVKYNPFKTEQFTVNNVAIYYADVVYLMDGKAYVAA